ncbi:uncharacterized protein LOC112340437 [Selaginella moellendorffii]|uniref:uncharacterized protein LOC112340437 n=2 Tax=Selaginella moellendorffii TaxID=88036 RepID=UPI000D1C48D6|nr:uncharacterized protein LOC112340437 [Selaginella moellendorffii]|eukprot:XP_024520692.1 uncharacterized protein LOC112340437 [Selaginella moellendorffii]
MAMEQKQVEREIQSRISTGMTLFSTDVQASARELQLGISLADEKLDQGSHMWSTLVAGGKCMLGQILYITKDYPSAVKYLKQGISLGDCRASSYYYLGRSYARVGALDEALEQLHRCIGLDGIEWLACIASSEVQQELKNYVEASRMAAEAAQRAHNAGSFADSSNYWAVAGSIEVLHTGDYKTAAAHLVSSMEAALLVEDPELQLSRLSDASPFLVDCIDTYKGSSLENLETETAEPRDHLETETAEPRIPHAQKVERSLKLKRAEAYAHMGMAQLVLLNLVDKACKCLHAGAELLLSEHGSSEDAQVRGVLFMLQYTLAGVRLEYGTPEEALGLYAQCKLLAPTPRLELKCDVHLAHCVKRQGHFREATQMLTRLLTNKQGLLAEERDVNAQLLFELGQSLLGTENTIQAVINLEAARRLWEEVADTSGCLQWCWCVLFQAYMLLQRFSDALDLAKLISSNLEKLAPGAEQLWYLINGGNFAFFEDHEFVRDKLTACLDTGSQEHDWLEKTSILLNLGNAYRQLGDSDAALEKYEEVFACISRLSIQEEALVQDTLACVHLNRSVVYRNQALEENQSRWIELSNKQLTEAQAAVTIYQQAGQAPSELGFAYLSQAAALINLKSYRDAEACLDRAEALTSGSELKTAKVMLVRAGLLEGKDELERAQVSAHKALLLLMEMQSRLRGLEHAWVTLLAGDMRKAFYFMQKLLIASNRYMDALLWAERSRMRLYFYNINQRTVQDGEEGGLLRFDRDDQYAIDCIREAVTSCPPGSAVVEYTCPTSTEDVLYIYVVQQEQCAVHVRQVDLKNFFSSKPNKRLGKRLDALVKRTRTAIAKDTAEVKVGLGILHELLIVPVQELLASCSSVIFAPHDVLSLVPFAALYDGNEFLVKNKAVGTVPSLRALGRCLIRQEEFAKRDRATAFVAGNPEPMGLGLPQLKGAAQEAGEVGQQLGVDAVIGSGMTKAQVMSNMSKASVVVLVTHGLLDRYFQHGALVMQAGSTASVAGMREAASSALVMQSAAASAEAAKCRTDEVITAKEIETLEVQAGLVVLSACHAGEGQVSSEGLLGLGRAVLQAGAVCVLVTLWKVNDAATPELVTGFFDELLRGRRNVHDALRAAMLRMLHLDMPVRIWAPMVAFGSPGLMLNW